MLLQCTEAHRVTLMDYLERDVAYHTFLLSDIALYGFQHPHQQVYLEQAADGACQGVYLRYYNNLILAGDPPSSDFTAQMTALGVDTVMGPAVAVKAVSEGLAIPHSYVEKCLLALRTDRALPPDPPGARIAGAKDAHRIHAFLMTIPAFRQMYASEEMIEGRIASGEGNHIYLEDGGQIVAHVNSAARTAKACMLGGLATAKPYRGQGLATELLGALCRRELQDGRQPSVFSELPLERSIFGKLGFVEIGKWGVLSVQKT